MRKRFIVLACLVAGGDAECSDIAIEDPVASQSQAIKDGNPATGANLFGAVAVLDSDGAQGCSGVLVSPTCVVTAAHCVVLQDGLTGEIVAELGPANLQVLAGALEVANSTAEQIFRVRKVLRHHRFPGPGALNSGHIERAEDIALLLLEDPVRTMPPVPLIPLEALNVLLDEGPSVVIAGYGAQDELGQFAGSLHFAETPFLERGTTEFSAGGPGSPDTCSGDSGGPALLVIAGEPHLIGVSVRALRSPDGPACGEGGIYTLVPVYRSWLEESAEGELPVTGAVSPNGCSIVGSRWPSGGAGGALFGAWMASFLAASWRSSRRPRRLAADAPAPAARASRGVAIALRAPSRSVSLGLRASASRPS